MFFVVKKTVKLNPNEEYMTLNVLLKITGVIPTGGMAKVFLASHPVMVNGEPENRRGRKLYNGDTIVIGQTTYSVTK